MESVMRDNANSTKEAKKREAKMSEQIHKSVQPRNGWLALAI
jgi:hypothetical protein